MTPTSYLRENQTGSRFWSSLFIATAIATAILLGTTPMASAKNATQVDGFWWTGHDTTTTSWANYQGQYQVGHNVETVRPGLSCRASGFGVTVATGHGYLRQIRVTEYYTNGANIVGRNQWDWYYTGSQRTASAANVTSVISGGVTMTPFNWMNYNAGEFAPYYMTVTVITTTHTAGATSSRIPICL